MAPTLLKLALSLALGSGLPTLGKVVPLASSRGACQGRVDELTCAKLLVLKSSAKLLDGKVSDDAALCERLLQGQNRIDRAEVQVCVQEGARVYATDAKFESEMGHFVEHVVLRRRTLVDGPMMANPSAKSIETQGNLGNFVWSTGAGRLVNPFTTLGVTSNQDANIFATANLINPAASMVNMARYFAHTFQSFDVPTVTLGIGVQIKFGNEIGQIGGVTAESIVDDFNPIIANFSNGLDPVFDELFLALAKHAPRGTALISSRGEITADVCMRHGVLCEPNGCPSLTLNRDVRLGANLEDKFRLIAARVARDERLRLAITLPAIKPHWPSMHHTERTLLEILFLHIAARHDTIVVIQTKYDFLTMKTLRKQHGAKFPNVTELSMYRGDFDTIDGWKETLAKRDLVLGGRIHGTMMGIYAAVPSILVGCDFRQWELATAMQIPMVTHRDFIGQRFRSPGAAGQKFDMKKFIATVAEAFRGATFDRRRREVVRNYQRMLAIAGLEINPELYHLL